MDNFETEEQPEVSEQALESNVNEKEEIGATTSQEEGSQFGKFNSPEELLKAYNNLQAEFTRKSQKLSEIQKQVSEKGEQDTSKKDETNLPPAYEQDDWRSKVATFLMENDKAKEFSREISNEILKDPGLQGNPNVLDIAWSRVLSKNYKSPAQIVGDSSFMENYILSNENIKKKIISSYIDEIQTKKSPSVIGSGIKGGMSLLTKGSKPSSLNDAKALAEKLFK